jgi:hypothetical protein
MESGASKMRRAPDHLTQPLSAFRGASYDLSAFGALGSLLGATSQVQEGMDELSRIVQALSDEYGHEAKALRDVSRVFTEVDTLLGGELSTRQG